MEKRIVSPEGKVLPSYIVSKVIERQKLRRRKEFEAADKIRDQLHSYDSPQESIPITICSYCGFGMDYVMTKNDTLVYCHECEVLGDIICYVTPEMVSAALQEGMATCIAERVGRRSEMAKKKCPGGKIRSKGKGKGLGRGKGRGPIGKPKR